MSFNNTTYPGIESMVGLVNGDTQLRAPTNITFFNNGTINTTINSSGNWIMNNNLTVSGTFQAPGVLYRTETVLPSSFNSCSLNNFTGIIPTYSTELRETR